MLVLELTVGGILVGFAISFLLVAKVALFRLIDSRENVCQFSVRQRQTNFRIDGAFGCDPRCVAGRSALSARADIR